MNRVIYTAIFGNKEKLREPVVIPNGFDFICFTDAAISSKHWKVVTMKPPHPHPTRAARRVKILAHEYVSQYDQSIWIDGNLIVRDDVNSLADRYLANNTIALYDHRATKMDPVSNLKQEYQNLIKREKQNKIQEESTIIEKQYDFYQKEGYPDDNGMAVTMVLLRQHNNPLVKAAMLEWWNQIERFSNRDQMSFNYVMWKLSMPFEYIEGDSRDNEFFRWVPHEDVSVVIRKWHKLLKWFR